LPSAARGIGLDAADAGVFCAKAAPDAKSRPTVIAVQEYVFTLNS